MATLDARAAASERLSALSARQNPAAVASAAQRFQPGAIGQPVDSTPRESTQDFLFGPSLANIDLTNVQAKTLTAPAPLKLLMFVGAQVAARPYLLPPPGATNPGKTAVRAAIAGQWIRLLEAGIPPMSTASADAQLVHPDSVAKSRCLLAAMLGARRVDAALIESTSCLSVMLKVTGQGEDSQAGAGAGAAALCTFLLLHAEALRCVGCWRESVFASHGLVRILQAVATGVAVETGVGEGEWAGTAAATWASAEPYSCEANAPVAERSLAYIKRVSRSGEGSSVNAHLPRLLTAAAMCTAEALQDAGYMIAAGNALSDAAAVLCSLAREQGSADHGLGSRAASFAVRAACAPSWLWAGVLCSAQVQLARSLTREAEAAGAQANLESLPCWAQGLACVTTAAKLGDARTVDQLLAAPLGEQYTGAVQGVSRSAALMQAGRFAEALPMAECALVLAAQVVRATDALCVHGDTDVEEEAVYGPDAGTAAACLLQYARNPSDLLTSALVQVSECVRRMPPVVAIPGQAPTPPAAVAAGVLESALRACPALCLREDLITSLCTLYDSGRDPSTSGLAKRALQGLAGRFGKGHIEPVVFRIGTGI